MKSSTLTKKIVWITGASSGLGEQIAYQAAKEGAILILSARRMDRMRPIIQRCHQLSGQPAYAYQMDMTDNEQITRVYQHIKSKVGMVDILVNNAGFGLFDSFTTMPAKTITEMIQVNLTGLLQLTQKVASDMQRIRRGQIINIGSQGGKMPSAKAAVYGATKAAVIAFSESLRMELRPFDVQVLCVNPGPIDTPFFDRADLTGRYLAKVGALVLDAETLAKEIVAAMLTKRREINRPAIMEIAHKGYVLFPRIGDFFASRVFNKK